jgi:hypothetical protein
MRDHDGVELSSIAELGADELEAVSAGEADTNAIFQMISNCLRMISDVQKSAIANVRV